VEAAGRSGALNSARHARDLGRPLMAVPGPITSELSVGCHTVIREWQGALVTSAADVIECLSPVGSATEGPATDQAQGLTSGLASGLASVPAAVAALLDRDALDRDAAAVLDALPSRGGMGPARIAAKAGLDLDTVLRCLGTLAAIGFAERCDQGWRFRRG
jgi:DNA processing protein